MANVIKWSCDEFTIVLGEGESTLVEPRYWIFTRKPYTINFESVANTIQVGQTRTFTSNHDSRYTLELTRDTFIDEGKNYNRVKLHFYRDGLGVITFDTYSTFQTVSYVNYGLLTAGPYDVTSQIGGRTLSTNIPIVVGTHYPTSDTNNIIDTTGYGSSATWASIGFYSGTDDLIHMDVAVNFIAAGTVTGGGDYVRGSNITLTTTNLDATKYEFNGWMNTSTGETESTATTYVIPTGASTPSTLYYVARYSNNGYKPTTDPTELDTDDIEDTKPSGWMTHGSTGMYCIFIPTAAQLQNLGEWLYSPNFLQAVVDKGLLDIDITKVISTLMVLPVNVTSAGTKNIKVGWWSPTQSYQTQLQMNYTNSNYVELNCGTVNIAKIYNGALDYQTQAEIYLPYIGYKTLETYDVMGHNITPIYQIDVMTGDCICKIKIDNSIKYQFTGNCGYSIPLSQVNNNGIISKGISGAVAAIGFATGNPVTSVASNAFASTMSKGRAAKEVVSRGGSELYPNTMDNAFVQNSSTYKRTESQNPIGFAKEMIGIFANMGSGVSHGGSLNGNTGYMSIGKPFLNIVRPHVDVPNDFGKYNGYPCNKKLALNILHGFTMVDEIHLTGFNATNDELKEIEQLLKQGVVL